MKLLATFPLLALCFAVSLKGTFLIETGGEKVGAPKFLGVSKDGTVTQSFKGDVFELQSGESKLLKNIVLKDGKYIVIANGTLSMSKETFPVDDNTLSIVNATEDYVNVADEYLYYGFSVHFRLFDDSTIHEFLSEEGQKIKIKFVESH
ncbi:hypothetical protein METBIDRAFT_83776 [Metschnikowia bicuspidata var. bicuspidata NRRL YB-4993]|uniref:Hyphally-regulated cell wall protein N-terminal domain-containing protein n=1 Tax=Metschnikowia bicuspidata var. bicuspidata NRRL YB-4993 TaxID=869754 RepID=A0A1A0H9I2_9ASCO|nr:hypothetical protein METBIDRAFT_83776 [Metschnikowia bicuspidata var. bicuspidata NRRL YB-4993]OBA20784.1 hypothetical protein METBIDRAFT_83776 [Metschnikowia bicuspidata var. bicuspidata NRRL YB-4993]